MNFIITDHFLHDVYQWERKLPPYDAFVGIPRSGVFPAAMLAMRRNVKLLSIEQLLAPIEPGLRVLVVDDNAGEKQATLNRYRELLAPSQARLEFGVVYKSFENTKVDQFGRFLFPPPIFEYDWHRRFYVEHLGLDMDGVICEDFHGVEQEGNDPEYARFIRDVRPLYVPALPTTIVTGRLEKWRPQTTEWLERHKIPYRKLIMYPGCSALARRRTGNAWLAKAEFLARSDAWFFVESNEREARQIVAYAKKPVFVPATHHWIQP